MRIEKSVRGSLFGITRLCRVMPNSDPEGLIFLSAPNNPDRFFFLYISWSPAFDFNVGVAINEWRFYTWTSAILKVDGRVWRRNDVNSQHLNNRVTWHPIQPMYWQYSIIDFCWGGQEVLLNSKLHIDRREAEVNINFYCSITLHVHRNNSVGTQRTKKRLLYLHFVTLPEAK